MKKTEYYEHRKFDDRNGGVYTQDVYAMHIKFPTKVLPRWISRGIDAHHMTITNENNRW